MNSWVGALLSELMAWRRFDGPGGLEGPAGEKKNNDGRWSLAAPKNIWVKSQNNKRVTQWPSLPIIIFIIMINFGKTHISANKLKRAHTHRDIIYIYIYVCVCVCVCLRVKNMTSASIWQYWTSDREVRLRVDFGYNGYGPNPSTQEQLLVIDVHLPIEMAWVVQLWSRHISKYRQHVTCNHM